MSHRLLAAVAMLFGCGTILLRVVYYASSTQPVEKLSAKSIPENIVPVSEPHIVAVPTATTPPSDSKEFKIDSNLIFSKLLENPAAVIEDFKGEKLLLDTARKDLLRSSNDNFANFSSLVGVIGRLESMQAQALLREIVSSSLPEDHRMRAMTALAYQRHPTSATLDLFWQIYRTESSTVLSYCALQMIGIAVKNGMSDDPARAKRTIDQLSQEINAKSASKDNEGTISILEALGNTSSDRVVTVIEPFLTSNSTEVRITSLNALKNLSNRLTDKILISRLKQEKNPQVRVRIASLISERAPSKELSQAASDALRREKNKETRAILAKAVAKYTSSNRKI